MSYAPMTFSTSSGASLRPSESASMANLSLPSPSIEQQIARAISAGHFENAADILKALMESQQALASLRKEYENLEAENVDLRLRLKADKHKDVASIEIEVKAQIARAAKFFVVFMTPSISTESFSFDKPRFPHDSPERFEANNSKYGVTAELYHSIPEKYISFLMKHQDVKDEFLTNLSSGRSLALDRFRTNASRVFKVLDPGSSNSDPSKELEQALFAKTVVRSKNPRVQTLLGLKDGGKTFSKLPPVLFAQENPSIISELFLNPALFRLGRLIVYGQTSLDQKDPEKLTMRTNNPYFHPATKLPPTATPGFISWMSMMACYILSDDTEFNSSGIGSATGTKYLDNFNFYKQILIEGLASKAHFSDLFSTWNREVFPRSQALEVVPDSQPASYAGFSAINAENHLKLDNVADIFRQLSFEEQNADPTPPSGTGPDHHSAENDSDPHDFYVPDPPRPCSLTPTELVESQPMHQALSIMADPVQAIPTPNSEDIVLPEPPIVPTQRPQRSRAAKAPTVAKNVPTTRTRKAKASGSNTDDPAIPSTTHTDPMPAKTKRGTRAKTRAG